MRLLLAIIRYFPHGGLQRDLLAIARRLAEAGHAVTIATAEWRGPEEPGIDRLVLPIHSASNHGFDRAFGMALNRHPVFRTADLRVGFDKLAGLDWYYQGDRCYACRASARSWLRLTPRFRAKAALERSVFDRTAATRILLLNAAEGERYRSVYGTPPERFHPLPPNVTPERLAAGRRGGLREATREALGLAPDEFALLLVGSAWRTKGIDRAIRALAALPRARLLIAGAITPDRCLAAGRRLGVADRLRLLGPRDDIPALMQAADLLLHPARAENTGTAIVEALASGLPVLCSGVCGYAVHVTRAGAGLVLEEPFRQAALDAALGAIRPERLAAWAAAARRYRDRTDLSGGPDAAVAALLGRRAGAS